MMIALTVGLATFAGTIFVHVLPLGATISIVRREKRDSDVRRFDGDDFCPDSKAGSGEVCRLPGLKVPP